MVLSRHGPTSPMLFVQSKLTGKLHGVALRADDDLLSRKNIQNYVAFLSTDLAMAEFDLLETPKPSKVPVVKGKAKTQPRATTPGSSH